MIIHCDDLTFFTERVEPVARRIAAHFGLHLSSVEPKRRPSPDGALGLCYCNENRVCLVLRWRALKMDGGRWWGERLSDKTIFDTLAHEMAHLRHGDHSKEFWALDKKINAWMYAECEMASDSTEGIHFKSTF